MSRSPASLANREQKKSLRSAVYQSLKADGQLPVDPTPATGRAGCVGCNYLNHFAERCQRDPRMCAKCCARADSKGACPYHRQQACDLAAVLQARRNADA
jgi:2-keto-4-pentenoate hydratase/2-oxohepta-3-ene-1,7-dioic acid hydratase in catechol pathway